MSPRLSIVAGLVTGLATGALVIGGILAFAPEPVPIATPAPQASLAVASPVASASSSASAGSSAVASGPVPSASGVAAGLFHVGEIAPPLVVPQVGGGTIDIANLRGKPVWVNFMGTYCPPCQDEFPLMNGFATRYASAGLVILAIDVKEDEGTVAAFADRLNATFPLGLDADGAASKRWDAIALPVHFWIDKEGIVRAGALGGIGPVVMAEALRKVLPGVTITP
jgi:thiol-disulfide isomerase/thioredoxin